MSGSATPVLPRVITTQLPNSRIQGTKSQPQSPIHTAHALVPVPPLPPKTQFRLLIPTWRTCTPSASLIPSSTSSSRIRQKTSSAGHKLTRTSRNSVFQDPHTHQHHQRAGSIKGLSLSPGTSAPRISASRSSSPPRGVTTDVVDLPQPNWVNEHLPKFEIVNDSVELSGYQLYAVEKWLVERTSLLTSIVVHTGDESHKLYCTELQPKPSLTEFEAQIEFDLALKELRQHGSRSKESEKGTIIVTSLPNFPSDLSIVHIPGGNLRAAQESLYTNINLLRVGCSGRSALTLDEPFESTKEKFAQMYHFPEAILHHPHSEMNSPGSQDSQATSPSSSRIISQQHHRHSKSLSHTLSPHLHPSHANRSGFKHSDHAALSPTSLTPIPSTQSISALVHPIFQTTVINLVKHVQAALSVFGWYPLSATSSDELEEEGQDGLLCDRTVEGLRNFILEMGHLADVEVTDRLLDPAVVAALFSIVITVRNKLHALGVSQPKDPFMEPAGLLYALHAFQRTFKTNVSSITTNASLSSSAIAASRRPLVTTTTTQVHEFLDSIVVEKINELYTEKTRPPEPYKVHRVLKNKIDDSIAMATSTVTVIGGSLRVPGMTGDDASCGPGGSALLAGGPGVGSLEHGMIDLELFARMVVASGIGSSSFKHVGEGSAAGGAGIESLRWLWLGRTNSAMRDREKRVKDRETMWLEMKNHVLLLRERGGDHVDGEEESESLGELLWRGTGRVKRNIEAGLSGLGIGRKSTDVQSDPELPATAHARMRFPDASMPALKISDPSVFSASSSRLWLSPNGSAPPSVPQSPLLFPSTGPSSAILPPPTHGLGVTSTPSLVVNDENESDHLRIEHRPRPTSLPAWGEAVGSSRSDPLMEWLPDGGGGWRRGQRKRNINDVFSKDELDWYSDEHEGAGGSAPIAQGTGTHPWIVRPPKYKANHDTERRHSFTSYTDYVGFKVLPVERMKADVDLCGVFYDLRQKHEDMRRISSVLQALVDSVKETNDALFEKATHLNLAYSNINRQAEQFKTEIRGSRPKVEEMANTAASLDYRMSELRRGTERVNHTLAGYRRQNREMRAQARQYGGDDFPGNENDEDLQEGYVVVD